MAALSAKELNVLGLLLHFGYIQYEEEEEEEEPTIIGNISRKKDTSETEA
jgi:hypothetical protein